MAGTFVALDDTEGFLPDSEGGEGLSVGDLIWVRVTRAGQGGKGPRLTVLPADSPPARGPGALLELAQRFRGAPVLTDDAALAARLRPVLAERLQVVPGSFEEIEEQADALAQSDVALPGGMQLRIHPTPALVAIDIDLGGALASGGRKDATHFALNRAVLPALARQIRLRIYPAGSWWISPGCRRDGDGHWHLQLHAALAGDPLRPRLLGFTNLGLAEIVRPRVHPPLHEMQAGPHAAGLAALRRIASEVAAAPHSEPMLRASPAVLAALQADPDGLPDLARRTGVP